VGKIPNFDRFGDYSRTSTPINVKIGKVEERTVDPIPHVKFHVYRSNVSPLRGEKKYFCTTK